MSCKVQSLKALCAAIVAHDPFQQHSGRRDTQTFMLRFYVFGGGK